MTETILNMKFFESVLNMEEFGMNDRCSCGFVMLDLHMSFEHGGEHCTNYMSVGIYQ